MKVKCPTCKKEVEYEGNPFRPFCSDRCKLIDLGEWASGNYQIPVQNESGQAGDKSASSTSERDDSDGE